MTKVFLTGGTGYVGSRIAAALLNDGGFDVVVATRAQATSLEYLPGAAIVSVDFDDIDDLARKMAGASHVIHLAAANEIICAQDMAAAIRSNISHGCNTLQAARKAGVKRFINFSTAHVYGQLCGKIDENTLPRPNHPYAITHLGFETFVAAAQRQNQIEGINLRLSNGFGAPQHPDVDRWTLVANDLCRQVAENRKMVLKSDGTQQRDFIGLSDVARITIGLLRLDPSALGDGVFNLGSGKTLSIGDMARLISNAAQKLIGTDIPIRYGPPQTTGQTLPDLHYCTDRLAAVGLRPDTDFALEIQDLLATCLRFFPK